MTRQLRAATDRELAGWDRAVRRVAARYAAELATLDEEAAAGVLIRTLRREAQNAAQIGATGVSRVLAAADVTPAGIAATSAPVPAALERTVRRDWRVAAAHPAGDTMRAAAVRRIVDSALTDAWSDGAEQAMRGDPAIIGWRRVSQPGCCGACLALTDGRVRPPGTPFPRHPHCFPAGVVVSGPRTEAATRRWYAGELVVIRTATGDKLPVTPNHPVLTDQGWLPAGLLHVGAQVFRRRGHEGPVKPVDPDEEHAPALVDDVFRSFGVTLLGGVPVAAEDFHGDGGHGHVDVVGADRFLRRGREIGDPAGEHLFGGAHVQTPLLTLLRARNLLLDRHDSSADGIVGRCDECSTLFGGEHAHPESVGLGTAANRLPSGFEMSADHVAGDAVGLGERELGFSSAVARHNVLGQVDGSRARFDPTLVYGSPEGAKAYARLGRRLAERLASDVEPDTVVQLDRVGFAGHVYSLQTSQGWHSANGVIVSNCHCIAEPVVLGVNDRRSGRPTAQQRFDAMSPDEQDRMFLGHGGKAKADLIRSGDARLADLVTEAPRPAGRPVIFETPLAELQPTP